MDSHYLINMKKPNYIEKIEEIIGNDLSVMDLPNASMEFDKLINSKFELVYSISSIEQDLKITFKEKLYKTKQEFYLYLLITDDDNIQLRVYYKQTQLDELRLLFGQLLKQKNLWKLQQKS
jgi:hypothetical protein